jgi:hypothetical protein
MTLAYPSQAETPGKQRILLSGCDARSALVRTRWSMLPEVPPAEGRNYGMS